MFHKKCNQIIKQLRLDLFAANNTVIDRAQRENTSSLHLLGELHAAQKSYNEIYDKYDSMKKKHVLEVANLYLKIDELNKVIKRGSK